MRWRGAIVMPDFQKPLMMVVAVLAIGLGLMTLKAQRLETINAQLIAKYQATIDAVDIAGRDRLIAATNKAETLALTLRTTEAELKEIKERKQHAIVQYATNRTCFNADLVRVLNSTDTRSEATRMPTSTGIVDTENEAVATDTDVASWVENAQEQYNVCTARYHALIDWHIPLKGQP